VKVVAGAGAGAVVGQQRYSLLGCSNFVDRRRSPYSNRLAELRLRHVLSGVTVS
jgi:hypothetical protein